MLQNLQNWATKLYFLFFFACHILLHFECIKGLKGIWENVGGASDGSCSSPEPHMTSPGHSRTDMRSESMRTAHFFQIMS